MMLEQVFPILFIVVMYLLVFLFILFLGYQVVRRAVRDGVLDARAGGAPKRTTMTSMRAADRDRSLFFDLLSRFLSGRPSCLRPDRVASSKG